ncbi:hypothetical protein [Geodermatophilus saharensis]|nr:hypothetical protein [Geodermatophilus saharensis]
MRDVVAKDLVPQVEAFYAKEKAYYEAEKARLSAEADKVARQLADLEAEHARVEDGRHAIALFVDFAQSNDSPLHVDAVRIVGHTDSDKPSTGPDGGPGRESLTSDLAPPSTTPDSADARPPTAATPAADEPKPVRIARIMCREPQRSWRIQDLVPLLYNDPPGSLTGKRKKSRDDTVGTTLRRMTERGWAAHVGHRFSPTANTWELLAADEHGLAVAGNGHGDVETAPDREAMRIAT